MWFVVLVVTKQNKKQCRKASQHCGCDAPSLGESPRPGGTSKCRLNSCSIGLCYFQRGTAQLCKCCSGQTCFLRPHIFQEQTISLICAQKKETQWKTSSPWNSVFDDTAERRLASIATKVEVFVLCWMAVADPHWIRSQLSWSSPRRILAWRLVQTSIYVCENQWSWFQKRCYTDTNETNWLFLRFVMQHCSVQVVPLNPKMDIIWIHGKFEILFKSHADLSCVICLLNSKFAWIKRIFFGIVFFFGLRGAPASDTGFIGADSRRGRAFPTPRISFQKEAVLAKVSDSRDKKMKITFACCFRPKFSLWRQVCEKQPLATIKSLALSGGRNSDFEVWASQPKFRDSRLKKIANWQFFWGGGVRLPLMDSTLNKRSLAFSVHQTLDQAFWIVNVHIIKKVRTTGRCLGAFVRNTCVEPAEKRSE